MTSVLGSVVGVVGSGALGVVPGTVTVIVTGGADAGWELRCGDDVALELEDVTPETMAQASQTTWSG